MLDWFGGEASIPELIQRKKYDKAERLLRKEFDAGRRDPQLRLQLADVIALAGRGVEAVPIYIGLADEFARAGHAPKAIAILKKIEKVSPGRGGVADRLAALIGDRGAGAAAVARRPEARSAAAARGAPGRGEPEFDLNLYVEPRATRPEEPAFGEDEDLLPADAVSIAAPDPPDAPAAGGIDPAFASPLFGDFSREDLLAVMRSLRFLTFEAGDIIVGDGEPGDSLFVISSGRAKAFIKGTEGRYREAREMGEGDFFGEIALLYGRPRTATVTAADSCELLELKRATVESLAATRPRVREILESFCSARVGAGA